MRGSDRGVSFARRVALALRVFRLARLAEPPGGRREQGERVLQHTWRVAEVEE